MRKLKRVFRLVDPYPNVWYEIFCYVKAFSGGGLIIGGLFLFLISEFFVGSILVVVGLYLFWRIKLVRDLFKLLL